MNMFFSWPLIYTLCLRYCPGCRNDSSEVVLAGEKLKESKKKAKMASASSSSQRDWGKVGTETMLPNSESCIGRKHNLKLYLNISDLKKTTKQKTVQVLGIVEMKQ